MPSANTDPSVNTIRVTLSDSNKQVGLEELAGFRKLDPSYYYFTWGLIPQESSSINDVPLGSCTVVPFGGFRRVTSLWTAPC